MDLAIPEFSGFDIFDALKAEGLPESKNVLIFTASSVPDQEVQEMLSSGAKGVLREPLSIDDLTEAVELPEEWKLTTWILFAIGSCLIPPSYVEIC